MTVKDEGKGFWEILLSFWFGRLNESAINKEEEEQIWRKNDGVHLGQLAECLQDISESVCPTRPDLDAKEVEARDKELEVTSTKRWFKTVSGHGAILT